MTGFNRPLLVVVGGFLGGGKTTTIHRTSTLLRERGLRVAVITNDQSSALVDTEIARGASDAVIEIPDGCFCCRFDTFQDAIQRLVHAGTPDVILAEAVGSCTDLAATVYQPLQQLTSGLVDLAPLTVVADGRRVHDINLTGHDTRFPASIAYLYDRQLAEADVILLNKVDLLTPAEESRVLTYLSAIYPGATVLPISASTGAGFAAWLAAIERSAQPGHRVIELDYDRYAEAEASLGWLNLSGTLHMTDPQSGTRWLRLFLDDIAATARADDAEVAHIKAWIDTGTGSLRGHLVGANRAPEFFGEASPFHSGRVLVNARAPVPPEVLSQWIEGATHRASTSLDARFEVTISNAFSPARPVPLHRLLPVS